ncbi:unnamed protein product [Ceratitis capitata]|uniref:(Mediterranean fruit fly) hypothetical protein n=1 Tax=Ceratitis capitata TaxID=7213 RepID=A0A811VHW2_CERCA|nr:unnamed protein product [Ceratitis capitata]
MKGFCGAHGACLILIVVVVATVELVKSPSANMQAIKQATNRPTNCQKYEIYTLSLAGNYV